VQLDREILRRRPKFREKGRSMRRHALCRLAKSCGLYNFVEHDERRFTMTTTVDQCKWSKERIAALSDLQLMQLSYDEMLEMVVDSGVPCQEFERIRSMETAPLVRLAYFARQFCRSQATSK
jgi:hypothetical protein